MDLLTSGAVWLEPGTRIRDCRDEKDDIYLELAAAARAAIIVSSDQDLLVLDPWRNLRILSAAAYLAGPRRIKTAIDG